LFYINDGQEYPNFNSKSVSKDSVDRTFSLQNDFTLPSGTSIDQNGQKAKIIIDLELTYANGSRRHLEIVNDNGNNENFAVNKEFQIVQQRCKGEFQNVSVQTQVGGYAPVNCEGGKVMVLCSEQGWDYINSIVTCTTEPDWIIKARNNPTGKQNPSPSKDIGSTILPTVTVSPTSTSTVTTSVDAESSEESPWVMILAIICGLFFNIILCLVYYTITNKGTHGFDAANEAGLSMKNLKQSFTNLMKRVSMGSVYE